MLLISTYVKVKKMCQQSEFLNEEGRPHLARSLCICNFYTCNPNIVKNLNNRKRKIKRDFHNLQL